MSKVFFRHIIKNNRIIFIPILAFLISALSLQFFRPIFISGQSMEPNYHSNQIVLVTPKYNSLNKGDVIIAKIDANNILLIKRIIACPNDTISIQNNKVYVNDKLLKEPYINGLMQNKDISEIKLSNNEYFIMGDNRNHSEDSRTFGPIKKDNILYKVLH